MANDRIFFRCKTCGECMLFVKFWGGGEFGPLFQKAVSMDFQNGSCGTHLTA